MKLYDLRDNPFKERFDHEIVGEDRVKTLAQVCNLVERSAKIPAKKQKGDRALAVINGTYGLGKTFTLWHLQNKILPEKAEKKKFFSNPDLKVACSSFRLLEGGKLGSKPTLYLYRSIVYNLGRKRDGRAFLNQVATELAETAKARKRTVSVLLQDLKPAFRTAFSELGEENPNEFLASTWLMAGKLKQKELEALGIKANIDSDKAAEVALIELLKVLDLCGYNVLLVLADEAEDIMVAGKKPMVQFLVTLRSLWDEVGEQMSRKEPVTPLVFISAFSPEAWELVETSAEKEMVRTGGAGFQPLLHRINENIFDLEPLSAAEARQLVEMLLAQEREKPRKDPLYPFTADAIETIRDHYGGNPRKIIGFCGKALMEGQKTNVKTINREFALQVLESQGGIESPADSPSTEDDSYNREI